jgi:hypothetical protein
MRFFDGSNLAATSSHRGVFSESYSSITASKKSIVLLAVFLE